VISDTDSSTITLNKESNTFLSNDMLNFTIKMYDPPSITPVSDAPTLGFGWDTDVHLDKISIHLEQSKWIDAIKENEGVLNFIQWDKPGYKLFNSTYGKIIYLRLREEPCHSYKTHYAGIENNTLIIELTFQGYKVSCNPISKEPFLLSEKFLVMKNSNFDKVKITIINSEFEIKELNELLIRKFKNSREDYHNAKIYK
jgi:hypothetical protein